MIVLLQGGYLEGKLRLPKGGEDGLRVVISTRPDRCTMHFFFIYLSKVFVNCAKGFRLALPVLLYNCKSSKSCKKSFSNDIYTKWQTIKYKGCLFCWSSPHLTVLKRRKPTLWDGGFHVGPTSSYGWPQLLLLFSVDNWESQWKEHPVPVSAQDCLFSSKVILSPLDLETEIIKQMPGIQYAHPTILYVVRKVLMLIIILVVAMKAQS